MDARPSIRQGTWSDLDDVCRVHLKSFDKSTLYDIKFPTRRTNPEILETWVRRRIERQYWTLGFVLTVLLDHGDVASGSLLKGDDAAQQEERIIGFTWWKRSASTVPLLERWLTLHAWLCTLIEPVLRLRDWLFPIPGIDLHRVQITERVFGPLLDQTLNSPRRRQAWYLAILAIDPGVQGQGLGSMLLADGLRRADRAGVATWLNGLAGTAEFYRGHGFVDVCRANVGELASWDGGYVMFRGE